MAKNLAEILFGRTASHLEITCLEMAIARAKTRGLNFQLVNGELEVIRRSEPPPVTSNAIFLLGRLFQQEAERVELSRQPHDFWMGSDEAGGFGR